MTLRKNSKSRLLLILFTIALASGAILFGFYDRYRQNLAIESALQPGSAPTLRKAPSFQLQDAQGKVHQLEDFRGKVVILHFWASWCPPCLDEVPQWLELGNHFKGKPVQMVAISLDTKWEDALKIMPNDRLKENTISLLDPEGASSEAYGSYQFPETYLLTKDLRIVTKLVGPQEWDSPGFHKIIDKVLSLSEVSGLENSHFFERFIYAFFDRKPLLLL